MKRQLPYGTWPSPVTPELLTAGTVGLVDVWVEGDRTVWLESRPADGGRLQLVVLEGDGRRRDLLPDGFSARSAVHEYGGGAAWVEAGRAWFVNWSDQRLYVIALDGDAAPLALTPEPASPRSERYADIRRSPCGRWLVCVRERHLGEHDVRNELVVLDAESPGEPRLVHAGHDFVMSPRFAAADRLRFVAWNQPEMPWTSTELIEVSFDATAGSAGEPNVLAGGSAWMQPLGDLAIGDPSGWWNLWSIDSSGERSHVHPVEAEIGGPAWVFGDRSAALLDDGRPAWSIGSTVYVDGRPHTTHAGALDQLIASGTKVTAIARFADRHPSVVCFDASDPSALSVVATPAETPLEGDDVSVPRQVAFPTAGGATAYAWFYPPTNSRVEGPADGLPPLVTMIHGGPTSDAEPWFALSRQFWTSRGFAVADFNHRGSTGFGTAFRNLLDGNWGVVDVEDCCAAASWLADQGLVDRRRIVIRGGSAGGFTVLACLTGSDVFAAGASLYGVADLALLAADTHKFEARYLDRLVGPWPEARDRYAERSPINHLDRLRTPLIVFQGLDDKVVPPAQSEAVVAALAANGVRHEYHAYEGEGHGFRSAATIIHQLNRELAFYQEVLGL